MGLGGPFKALLFQMHYTNPKRLTGVTDHSALTLFYTPNLRQYDLGTLWTGPRAMPLPIPPRRPAHFDNTLCFMAFPKNVTLNIIEYTFHAHLLVRGCCLYEAAAASPPSLWLCCVVAAAVVVADDVSLNSRKKPR